MQTCYGTDWNIESHVFNIDASEIEGEKYLKFSIEHGPEDYAYTVGAIIKEIVIYCTDKPTFDIGCKQVSENSNKITISNIQYKKNINNWQVKYKKSNEESWQTSNNLSFNVSNGIYNVKIVSGNIESKEKIVYATDMGYINDNLILHYDAINNTGNGHSSTATEWVDLSKSGNNGKINGATWNDNYLAFDGIDDSASTKNAVNYNNSGEVTVEFIDVNGGISNNNNVFNIFESSPNFNNYDRAFAISGNEFVNKGFQFGMRSNQNNAYNLKVTQPNVIIGNSTTIYDFIINTNSEYNNYLKIYKDGQLIEILQYNLNGVNLAYNISDMKIQNYIMYIAARAENTTFSKINLGALRVYNKELTQTEIQHNISIDRERFNITN